MRYLSYTRLFLGSFIFLASFLFSQSVYSGTFANITVDGDPSDWAGIPVLITDPLGNNPPNDDLLSVKVANDENFVYFLKEYADVPVLVGSRVYLDTDLDTSTGCLLTGVGAEFVAQGGFLGDSRDCSWGSSDFPGQLSAKTSGNFIEFRVSISTLETISPGLNAFDFSNGSAVTIVARYVLAQVENEPEFSCIGFDSPFDVALTIKKKAKGTIPAKMKLFDENSVEIVDADVTSPPVVNVTFDGFIYGDGNTDDGVLESVGSSNEGNVFAYNEDSGYWEYRVGTKQFPAAGTYTVDVRSGNEEEYTINPSCSQTFTRSP